VIPAGRANACRKTVKQFTFIAQAAIGAASD